MQSFHSHRKGRQGSHQGQVPTKLRTTHDMGRQQSNTEFMAASPLPLAQVTTSMFVLNHSLADQVRKLEEALKGHDSETADLKRELSLLKNKVLTTERSLSSCKVCLEERTAELEAAKAGLAIKEAQLVACSIGSSIHVSCTAPDEAVDAEAVIQLARSPSETTAAAANQAPEGTPPLSSRSSSPTAVHSAAASRRCSSSSNPFQVSLHTARTSSHDLDRQPSSMSAAPPLAAHEVLLSPDPVLRPVSAAVTTSSSKAMATEPANRGIKQFFRNTYKQLEVCKRELKALWGRGPSFSAGFCGVQEEQAV